MSDDILEITIEPGSLRVEYTAIRKSPHGRFYAGLIFAFFSFLVLCFGIFVPGKQGTSMYQDFHAAESRTTGYFFLAAAILALAWLLKVYLPIAYPGAQKLECDSNMLTVSRLHWLDWRNQNWRVDTYLLRDICRVRYGSIYNSRAGSIAGLRFDAAGEDLKLFPSLSETQAEKILTQLESLEVVTERQQKAAAKQARRLAKS
jgi:hypothetical protein